MQPTAAELSARELMTLEAFADTMLPGERRHPLDHAVAGASEGGGAVASGAVDLMVSEEGGLAGVLPSLVAGLNDHARSWADEHARELDDAVPAFVALAFDDRTTLVAVLTAAGHPEQELWVSLAMFSMMAWDTGASEHTVDALKAGHPGLTAMGFAAPDPDGLWRFPDFSYRRVLATVHPHTTASGDPA
jgi:hypothetical protein